MRRASAGLIVLRTKPGKSAIAGRKKSYSGPSPSRRHSSPSLRSSPRDQPLQRRHDLALRAAPGQRIVEQHDRARRQKNSGSSSGGRSFSMTGRSAKLLSTSTSLALDHQANQELLDRVRQYPAGDRPQATRAKGNAHLMNGRTARHSGPPGLAAEDWQGSRRPWPCRSGGGRGAIRDLIASGSRGGGALAGPMGDRQQGRRTAEGHRLGARQHQPGIRARAADPSRPRRSRG